MSINEIQDEMSEILSNGDSQANSQTDTQEHQEPIQEAQGEQVEDTQERLEEPAKPLQQPEKRKLTAQERQAQIRHETKLKWDAQRALEAEREALRKEKEELLRLRGVDQPNGPPKLDDYTEDQAHKYLEDLADWKAEQKIIAKQKELRVQSERERQESESRSIRDQYEREYQAKVIKDPSYAEKELDVARMLEVTGARHLHTALLSAENRVDLIEYLGDNLDVLESLSKKPPQSAYIEIGKILGQMQVQKPRAVSKAPAPTNPIRQSSGGIKSLADLDHKSFSDLRNKQEFGF